MITLKPPQYITDNSDIYTRTKIPQYITDNFDSLILKPLNLTQMNSTNTHGTGKANR